MKIVLLHGNREIAMALPVFACPLQIMRCAGVDSRPAPTLAFRAPCP